jgi:hypothetical protein
VALATVNDRIGYGSARSALTDNVPLPPIEQRQVNSHKSC